MLNRLIFLLIKVFITVVIISLGSFAKADNSINVSPALESFPVTLLKRFRTCTKQKLLFGFKPQAVDLLESWFREFWRPAYANIFVEISQPMSKQYLKVLISVHIRMNEVRLLVDYRTEQALISMLDATLQRYGDGSECQDVVSSLLLLVAVQRDRAWTWADVIDRRLKLGEDRWKSELRARNVTESLRSIVHSYKGFNRYKK